jgi:hypothetical protein
LTANEFGHHFFCSLAFGVSFSVNCLSQRLPVFLLEWMSSSYGFAEFLVVLGANPLSILDFEENLHSLS